jgi:flagellar hook-basal body complex protein FliE
MSISAISALAGSSGIGTLGSTSQIAAAGNSGSGFANVLGSTVDSLQTQQSNANALAVQAVTGNLSDVHDYTIAASEAKLSIELTAAVRNKAVDAFSEIMRMQA